MQGCPLRCAYCHNPDTWSFDGGTTVTSDELVAKILRYKPYFSVSGGVTVSGGEPLSQAEFVAELFKKLKRHGIHTALDTSGMGNLEKAKSLLQYTDLVMCDIKFSTNQRYNDYARGNLNVVLQFLQAVDDCGCELWVRHVVVPDLTASKENVQKIIDIATQFKSLKKIELLPFKKICTVKYDKMGIAFPLANHKECDKQLLAELQRLIPDNLK